MLNADSSKEIVPMKLTQKKPEEPERPASRKRFVFKTDKEDTSLGQLTQDKSLSPSKEKTKDVKTSTNFEKTVSELLGDVEPVITKRDKSITEVKTPKQEKKALINKELPQAVVDLTK